MLINKPCRSLERTQQKEEGVSRGRQGGPRLASSKLQQEGGHAEADSQGLTVLLLSSFPTPPPPTLAARDSPERPSDWPAGVKGPV